MYAYWGKGVGGTGHDMYAKAYDEYPLGGGRGSNYDREKVVIVVQPQSPPHQSTHQHSQPVTHGRK